MSLKARSLITRASCGLLSFFAALAVCSAATASMDPTIPVVSLSVSGTNNGWIPFGTNDAQVTAGAYEVAPAGVTPSGIADLACSADGGAVQSTTGPAQASYEGGPLLLENVTVPRPSRGSDATVVCRATTSAGTVSLDARQTVRFETPPPRVSVRGKTAVNAYQGATVSVRARKRSGGSGIRLITVAYTPAPPSWGHFPQYGWTRAYRVHANAVTLPLHLGEPGTYSLWATDGTGQASKVLGVFAYPKGGAGR